jgi:hypothetical protein
MAVSKPSFQYAVFCEDIVTRRGKKSILGITDAVKGKAGWQGVGPPPPIKHRLTLALGLLNVQKGTHEILVATQRPSGKLEESSGTVRFNVKNVLGITHIKSDIEFDIVENGIYRFPVLLDGEPIEEIKLLVDISITSA